MEFERYTLTGLPLGLDHIKRLYSQREFGVAVTALSWLLYAMSFFYSDGKAKRTSSDADSKFEDNATTDGSSLLTLAITLVTGPYLVIHFVNRNRRQIVDLADVEPKTDSARLKPGYVTSENRIEDEMFKINGLRQHLPIGKKRGVAVANDLDSNRPKVTQKTTRQNQDNSNFLTSPFSPTDSISSTRTDRADMSVQTVEMRSLSKVDDTTMTDVSIKESKAVNTSHKLLAYTKSVGTETTGPYKKKLRRAQKVLCEAIGKAKEEKKAKLKKWRRIMIKYRDKLIKLRKATEEKGTLMAYVRATNQASEKDVQGEAVALSDLKWKLQYQCKLNEKFSEDLRNKRTIVNSLNKIIKPECEK